MTGIIAGECGANIGEGRPVFPEAREFLPNRPKQGGATEPKAIRAPIHPKAMPVVLTTAETVDVGMQAPWDEAKAATAA